MEIFISLNNHSPLFLSSKFHLTLPPHLLVNHPPFPKWRIFYLINPYHPPSPPPSLFLRNIASPCLLISWKNANPFCKEIFSISKADGETGKYKIIDKESNIIGGLPSPNRNPPTPPHFQVLPAAQVDRGELSSAGTSGRQSGAAGQASDGSQLGGRQAGVQWRFTAAYGGWKTQRQAETEEMPEEEERVNTRARYGGRSRS